MSPALNLCTPSALFCIMDYGDGFEYRQTGQVTWLLLLILEKMDRGDGESKDSASGSGFWSLCSGSLVVRRELVCPWYSVGRTMEIDCGQVCAGCGSRKPIVKILGTLQATGSSL